MKKGSFIILLLMILASGCERHYYDRHHEHSERYKRHHDRDHDRHHDRD